jgi:hypothetical protein
MGYTLSGPAWTTMLTGVWDPTHGCSNNNYDGVKWDEFPYFTKRAKEVRTDLKSVQIITWNPFMPTSEPGGRIGTDFFTYSYDVGTHGQHKVTDAALIQLNDPDLDALFIHYDEPDATGHANGFSPAIPTYINAIQQVDSEIGEVLAALKARPNYANEDWLVLLTTDHGGVGSGHGGNSNTERKIWWAAWGPSVPHLEITGSDPGSYFIPSNPVDLVEVKQTPVLADIGVTALGHLLKNTSIDPETYAPWALEGKNWLKAVSFVEDIESATIEVKTFPNPSSGEFQIMADFGDSANKDVQWSLSDIQGRLITQGSNEQVQWNNGKALWKVDISDAPAGEYILTIHNGQKQTSRKVFVRN